MAKVRVKDPAREKYIQELAERLRVARKGARLSQQEVADRLGVKLNTYQKWEEGRTQFPMHRLLEFCQITGFPPGFMATGYPNSDWEDAGTESGTFKILKFDGGDDGAND